MKKVLICLIAIITVFTITGCNKKEETKNNTPEGTKSTETNKNNSTEQNNGKALVLYFSATGNTKKVAEKVALESKSDIIEIIPKVAYKEDDLKYSGDCRANREQNDPKARPEIKNDIDITKYDTIYLGYPIWWGTIPKIILTLLDKYDFTNKTIVPFCTSGSTGIKGSVSDLRNYNNKLNIKDGKRYGTKFTDKDIKDLINGNY